MISSLMEQYDEAEEQAEDETEDDAEEHGRCATISRRRRQGYELSRYRTLERQYANEFPAFVSAESINIA